MFELIALLGLLLMVLLGYIILSYVVIKVLYSLRDTNAKLGLLITQKMYNDPDYTADEFQKDATYQGATEEKTPNPHAAIPDEPKSQTLDDYDE